jgi:hypothetical protein
VYTGSWRGKLRERYHLGDPGVCGDNIKIDLQEVRCGSMGWIKLAQDRDRWQALLNVIMNLRVP